MQSTIEIVSGGLTEGENGCKCEPLVWVEELALSVSYSFSCMFLRNCHDKLGPCFEKFYQQP